MLESLKSGQVPPAIATLVSSLLTSNQQQQQPQVIRVKETVDKSCPCLRVYQVCLVVVQPAAVPVANGHHQQQPQQPQPQQSLLRTPAAPLRPSIPAGSGVPVQTFTLQPQQQPQLRPNSAVRPNALATLLSTAKAGALAPNISPGKGKVMQVETVAGFQGNAAQIVRPLVTVSGTPILPSYSQAISQTATGATVVRAIRPAAGPGGVVRRPTEAIAVNGATGQRFSLTVPALSALLAGK